MLWFKGSSTPVELSDVITGLCMNRFKYIQVELRGRYFIYLKQTCGYNPKSSRPYSLQNECFQYIFSENK